MRSVLWILVLSILGVLAASGSASAAALLTQQVSAAQAVDRSCTAKQLTEGAGYAQQTVAMPAAGSVTATLDASGGDWDLAVFDAADGRVVAGSAYRGSREVASGFATQGSELVVQACRLSGADSSASLSVSSTAIDTSNVPKVSLVRVSTPTQARKNELNSLGLDVTEHGGPGFLEVVLYGAEDARKLVENNFVYTIEVPDLALQARQDRLADARFAAANATTELPSGQNTYRRLFDYSEDMKRLAREHPDLVRPITLNHLTYEGRPVEGIEIATNPNARDGRPVFLQMGLHHAREWPSGEHAMEWAYELIIGYRNGDARVRSLVENTRTIVVPVVNPDGFNASREAGQLYMHGDGHHTDLDGSGDISDAEFILAAATNPNEYRRKNCAFPTGEGGSCLQPTTGIVGFGVDPNRNYGAFWGGPGSSSNPLTQTYHGPGPFSEPETQNVRELISGRQVTTLITNHTFSNLVLRPPGLASQGLAPDEPAMKALGDSMAAENGYTSQYGWQLYDTTGTTEDWSYSATGGYGYTFEIGDLGFHPPFAETVAEWNGTTDDATGGGNREAYYKAAANAADTAHHSVLAGRAPANAVLRLTKTFETPTYDGSTFTDSLNSTMQVGPDGVFEWHTNPSTRPLVMKESGRPATGEPSPAQQFNSRGGTVPCANYDTPPPSCYEDHNITVPSGTGIDNAKATFRIEWPTPASDWDMKIYRADAGGAATGEPVATSGQGATNFEEAVVADPAGDYVVRVINYAAVEPWAGEVTFEGPEPYQAAQQETWTLSCEQPEGTTRSARQVYVERGERRTLDLRRDCRIRR
ncbi:MAG TPA: M14 family metallopeptidase [Thermoleophilaceae bacterium]|nr:M14 family metallopeptidase [Thermoleophilaceae bacterium]